jgi:hypothetical protein
MSSRLIYSDDNIEIIASDTPDEQQALQEGWKRATELLDAYYERCVVEWRRRYPGLEEVAEEVQEL